MNLHYYLNIFGAPTCDVAGSGVGTHAAPGAPLILGSPAVTMKRANVASMTDEERKAHRRKISNESRGRRFKRLCETLRAAGEKAKDFWVCRRGNHVVEKTQLAKPAKSKDAPLEFYESCKCCL